MTSAREGLAHIVEQLPGISLDEVTARADLQVRVDHKYIVTLGVFERLVAAIGHRLAVLDIDQLRVFQYESIYFDTGSLAAYRQHAHGRRRRFKLRTRTYLDSGECLLEVKLQSGRGETVKKRMPYALEHRHVLTPAARHFAVEHLGDAEVVAELTEVVTSAYRRATLVDLTGGSRVTCDVDLYFAGGGRERQGSTQTVLIESKTVGAAALADAVLWQLGQRPIAVSKYCAGMALLRPELPANRWNRELRTLFGWEPDRAAPGPARPVR
ncbi:VTC domain-containing protein [Humibacillus xanthopallidus]|uniref:VTC domain-containing protein n=1 Tax=Humibacillus xanthopallidus TaxID=412689 RepID=A0A543I1S1_9MICO|nr:VTC domain-containing protein [Humibacillus xanthopallidus]TQM64538.1 VTC domain-containing protein [Humibacillus xanthopallidus]